MTRRQREAGESRIGLWLTPVHYRVEEAAPRRKWDAWQESLGVKVSPLVHAFWHETYVDLMRVSIKHCWGSIPRTLHHQRDNCPTDHAISYLNELAVHHPTSEAWDELVWLPMAVTPQVPTEAEPYGYCQGQAVDLGPMMLAVQFWVADE